MEVKTKKQDKSRYRNWKEKMVDKGRSVYSDDDVLVANFKLAKEIDNWKNKSKSFEKAILIF